MPRSSGQRLLSFDRKLGARFVAGADEAGRGSLAGPLVVAGVLLDYECLRNHRVRPLASLNDSKQVAPAEREELFRAVVGCASRISVRVIPSSEIDRNGLHRSNLWGLRSVLADLTRPRRHASSTVSGSARRARAPRGRGRRHEECRDRRRLDRREVTRDRVMRRLDALYPRYGFARRRLHHARQPAAAVRLHGPSDQHRLSFNALAYAAAGD